MEKDIVLKLFIRSLTLSIKIHSATRDRFFADKFGDKIYALAFNCIKLFDSNNDDLLGRGVLFEKALFSIDDLLGTAQDIAYLKFFQTSRLFLQTKINLLRLKLELTRQRNNDPMGIKPEARSKNDRPAQPVELRKKPEKDTKLNQSKRKILDFIRSSPGIRTKDIIHEFNALSDRTVKRNLMELLQTGLVQKRIENKAVYYSVAERSPI